MFSSSERYLRSEHHDSTSRSSSKKQIAKVLSVGDLLVGSYVIGFTLVYSIYATEPPRAENTAPVSDGDLSARDAGEFELQLP